MERDAFASPGLRGFVSSESVYTDSLNVYGRPSVFLTDSIWGPLPNKGEGL